MRAKNSFAMTAVCGVVIATVIAGVMLFRNDGSAAASDPVPGKAVMAVTSERAKARAKSGIDSLIGDPAEAQKQALEVTTLRNKIEAIEAARKQMQDRAHLRTLARRAAETRASALGELSDRQHRERASRDAERKKLEGTPKEIAMNLLGDHGWDESQFSCLDKLWTKESRWRVDADNPTSSAYGIPQALPGRRMAEYGADWRTNPVVQIRWGLDYIQDAYGSPCRAWSHSKATGWY